MDASRKNVFLAVVIVMALVFLSGLVGCSKKDGAGGSPYSVDYQIFPKGTWLDAGGGPVDKDPGINGSYWNAPCIIATVKGPAAKLAVILTNPKGEPSAKIIEKDDMVTNSRRVLLSMIDIDKGLGQKAQAGVYVLVVKTIDPEKIVWQKEVTFSPD